MTIVEMRRARMASRLPWANVCAHEAKARRSAPARRSFATPLTNSSVRLAVRAPHSAIARWERSSSQPQRLDTAAMAPTSASAGTVSDGAKRTIRKT